jgi:hypothetical protein
MPQAAHGFTKYYDGGAIVMPHELHIQTRTFGVYGRILAEEEAGLSFRTLLGRDIRDLRGIVGDEYDVGISQMLNYYRENFPELFIR